MWSKGKETKCWRQDNRRANYRRVRLMRLLSRVREKRAHEVGEEIIELIEAETSQTSGRRQGDVQFQNERAC